MTVDENGKQVVFPAHAGVIPKEGKPMTLKELPYQDGTNWKELGGKPAIFNWNGKPMAGILYLDGFSNLAVRELSGYMPVLYIWPDDTAHVNVKCVTDFHVFSVVED